MIIAKRVDLQESSALTLSLHFENIHFFRQQPQERALNCRWPADNCIVYYRKGGVRGDISIVYGVYALARKNIQLTNLTVLIKSSIIVYIPVLLFTIVGPTCANTFLKKLKTT